MSTRKTRAGTAIPTRAVGNGTDSQTAHASTTDDTTQTAERQTFHVADLLLHGEENAVPLKHLKELVELPGREVRRMIQQARLEGIPICANNLTGYYLAADDLERERFVKSMRHRAGEILKSADAIERTALAQESFFDGGRT